MRMLVSVLSLCFVVTSLGCGGGEKPIPQVPVSGKVTAEKGVPKGLGLTFLHSSGQASGTAIVADDGTFKGEAPVGECKISLFGAASQGGAHADAKSSKTKAAFWSDATTPWSVTVAEPSKDGIELSLDAKIQSSGPASHAAR